MELYNKRVSSNIEDRRDVSLINLMKREAYKRQVGGGQSSDALKYMMYPEPIAPASMKFEKKLDVGFNYSYQAKGK